MILSHQTTDKFAIGLSAACAVHCLALPLIATILPSVLTLPFADESFHFWMVVLVIPSSAYALTLGCKKHKHYRIAILGLMGLVMMVLAIALGERINESQEKLLTLLGASFIAAGHFFNYRLCRKSDQCACPNHSKNI